MGGNGVRGKGGWDLSYVARSLLAIEEQVVIIRVTLLTVVMFRQLVIIQQHTRRVLPHPALLTLHHRPIII